MGLVWVACVVLLDVNASYGPCHPTISSLYRGKVCRTNFLQSVLSTPLYLSSHPASGRAEPIICLLTCGPTCQWKCKRTHWTCTSFTSTCWWWKTNPRKIFGGRFWSYSRVVRLYLQFNPRCTSCGFNLSTTTLFSFMTRPGCWMSHVSAKGGRTRPNLRLCSRIRLVVLT